MVRVSLIGFLMMVEFFWHDIKIGEEVCMKVESQSGAKWNWYERKRANQDDVMGGKCSHPE